MSSTLIWTSTFPEETTTLVQPAGSFSSPSPSPVGTPWWPETGYVDGRPVLVSGVYTIASGGNEWIIVDGAITSMTPNVEPDPDLVSQLEAGEVEFDITYDLEYDTYAPESSALAGMFLDLVPGGLETAYVAANTLNLETNTADDHRTGFFGVTDAFGAFRDLLQDVPVMVFPPYNLGIGDLGAGNLRKAFVGLRRLTITAVYTVTVLGPTTISASGLETRARFVRRRKA